MAAHIIGNHQRRRLIFPVFPIFLSRGICRTCGVAQGVNYRRVRRLMMGLTPWLGGGLGVGKLKVLNLKCKRGVGRSEKAESEAVARESRLGVLVVRE